MLFDRPIFGGGVLRPLVAGGLKEDIGATEVRGDEVEEEGGEESQDGVTLSSEFCRETDVFLLPEVETGVDSPLLVPLTGDVEEELGETRFRIEAGLGGGLGAASWVGVGVDWGVGDRAGEADGEDHGRTESKDGSWETGEGGAGWREAGRGGNGILRRQTFSRASKRRQRKREGHTPWDPM